MNPLSNPQLKFDRNIGYTVKEIMTPFEELVFWDKNTQTPEFARNNALKEGFTYLPVKDDGKIIGILSTHEVFRDESIKPITLNWLVTADTPILKLIDIFATSTQSIFLVLEASQIVGLVSLADLNRVAARASVYLLAANFEQSLAKIIREEIGVTEIDFANLLTSKRINKLLEEQEAAKKQNINLSLIHYTYITDLTTIVTQAPKLHNRFRFRSKNHAKNELSFTTIRNAVSHQTSLMVVSQKQIQDLNTDIENIIKLMNRLSQNS